MNRILNLGCNKVSVCHLLITYIGGNKLFSGIIRSRWVKNANLSSCPSLQRQMEKKELRYLCIAQSTPLVGLSLIPRLQLRCSSMEQSLRQQFGVKMRLLLSAGSYPCVLPSQLCQPCCFSHQHHESGQEIDLAEEQHS